MPVLAYHLILTFYGFWLPNDPRGSWSDFVRAWELRRFGPATKTWARGEWKCFLFDEDYMRNAIRYVRRNPTREGFKPQRWKFLVPFTGSGKL